MISSSLSTPPTEDRLGPRAETTLVRERDTQHLGDDRHRQRERELGDQVELIPSADLFDQALRDLGDAGLQRVHGTVRETVAYQASQPCVVGGIHKQHVPAQDRKWALHGEVGLHVRQVSFWLFADGRAPQCRDDIGMSHDELERTTCLGPDRSHRACLISPTIPEGVRV